MILKELRIENMIGTLTNCYIIVDEEKHEGICIDPAGEFEKIMQMLDILNVKLKYIYLTHCHADHIRSSRKFKRKNRSKISNS